MKSKWKIVIGVVVLLLIGAGVLASVKYSQRGIVTVQTGKVLREDLASVVTASGEVKPRNYINIGAEYQGQLTEILVKEGDHVKKGQLLARIDEAQSQADVAAQRAAMPGRSVVVQQQLDLFLPVGHAGARSYLSIGARTTLPHSVQDPS